MPIKDLPARLRCIHSSCKDLNTQLLSKPISDELSNLCSKWQAFDITSKSRRLRTWPTQAADFFCFPFPSAARRSGTADGSRWEKLLDHPNGSCRSALHDRGWACI